MLSVLEDREHEVVGLDTGFYHDGWLYGPAWTRRCVKQDIRRVALEDLSGFDAVVHLGELSNDPLGQLDPEITYQVNYLGSVDFAAKCKRAGIPRFIYSSSCSVYGLGAGDLKTEESEAYPQTAYAECKLLVERALCAMADESFSPVCLRNATAYGPSPRMRFDLVLNNLAGLAWTTREIRMVSDGTPWRPIIHVQDICEAIACVLEAPRGVVHGEILNVGATEENYQIRQIAALVSDVFPGCAVTFGQGDGDNRSYRVSFEKIQVRLPRFRCRRNALAGVRELRQLFESIQLSRCVFEFRTFTRVRQLEHLLATGQIDRALFWTDASSLQEVTG